MKRILALTLSGALLASGGSAAFAQDFQGTYAGALLGYTFGDADAKFSLPAGTNARLTASESVSYDGWDSGLYIGQRFMLQSGFMLAFEGGALLSNAGGSKRETYGTRELKTGFDKSNEFYLSAKAGIPVQNVALVYGIAGLQSASFEGKIKDEDSGQSIAKKDEYLNGWNLGLGAEYFLANNLSTRIEWKYQSYSEMSLRGDGGRAKIDPSENVVRMGVSYNF